LLMISCHTSRTIVLWSGWRTFPPTNALAPRGMTRHDSRLRSDSDKASNSACVSPEGLERLFEHSRFIRRGTFEQSRGRSFPVPGTSGYAPVPETQRPGMVRHLAWRLSEVPLLFHHRRTFSSCGHTPAPAPDRRSLHWQLSFLAGEGARYISNFYGQGTGGHGRACALRV
jgi:hypothetical protein